MYRDVVVTTNTQKHNVSFFSNTSGEGVALLMFWCCVGIALPHKNGCIISGCWGVLRLQILVCSEPVCIFGVLQMVFNKQLRHVQKGCLVLMNNKLFEDHQQWCGSCSDAKLCWFISCAQTLFAIGLRNAGNVEKR